MFTVLQHSWCWKLNWCPLVELVKHFPVNTTRQSWHCWWWIWSNKPLVLALIFTVFQRWWWYKFSDQQFFLNDRKLVLLSILPNADKRRSRGFLEPNIVSCSGRWWIIGANSLTWCIFLKEKYWCFSKECYISSVGNLEITLLLPYNSDTQVVLFFQNLWHGCF